MLSSLTRAARRIHSVKVLLRRSRRSHQSPYQRRSQHHLSSRCSPRQRRSTLISLQAKPRRTQHTKKTESSGPILTLRPNLLASRRHHHLASRHHQPKVLVRRRREASPYTSISSTTLRTAKSSTMRYTYMTSAGVWPVVLAGVIENEQAPFIAIFISFSV